MPNLPIRPNLKYYCGLKEKLYRKINQRNRVAYRVTDYVNKLIADNPAEAQEYFFDKIAADLTLTPNDVCAAITDECHEGITVRVTNEDRRALAFYKVQTREADQPQVLRGLGSR